MSTTLAPQNPLSYMGVKPPRPPNVITENRAPTTLDTNYDLGTMWVDTTTPQVYFLAEVSGNTATWLPLGGGGTGVHTLTGNSGGMVLPTAGNINVVGDNASGIDVVGNPGTSTLTIFNTLGPVRFPITPYVVGPVGEAGYQTIQDALNAVTSAAMIWIQPGTYTENLVFPDQDITLMGDSGGLVEITGTHTPSAINNLTVDGVVLVSATDLFSSAAAGAGSIFIENSFFIVTNGYGLNLPNWTGQLSFDNCGQASTEDGGVFNTGGSFIKMINSEIGAGTANPMTIGGAGLFRLDTCNINCPITLSGSGGLIIQNGCKIAGTLTIGGSRSGTIINSSFLTGTAPSIVMNSSGDVSISHAAIDSTNVPAIDGTGAGNLTYGSLVFLNDTTFAGTLTLVSADWQPYSTAGNTATAVRGTSGFDSNDFIVTDGFVQLAASSGFTWNEVVVMGPTSMVANNGYVANNAGLVVLTLPLTAAFGTVIRVAGKGAGGWLIAQNAGQTIHFGVVDTSTGAGGSLASTDQYDAVELLCTEADTDWTVLSVIGNLTVI